MSFLGENTSRDKSRSLGSPVQVLQPTKQLTLSKDKHQAESLAQNSNPFTEKEVNSPMQTRKAQLKQLGNARDPGMAHEENVPLM